MKQRFTIKRGDTSPLLRWELKDPETNLVGATVVFNMKDRSTGAAVIERAPAVIVQASDLPTLQYEWALNDTAISGSYDAEFEITFADNSVETTPNGDNILILIMPDLG